MYLALFLVAILYLYVAKEEKNLLFKYCVLGGILVLFPITGRLVSNYFQGFYEADALLWLLPVTGLIGYAVTELYGKWQDKRKAGLMLVSVAIVALLSGFLSNDYLPDAAKNKAEKEEIESVFAIILAGEGERQVTLAAPEEIMVHARAFDGKLLTVYGRDIREQNLDYAFYGNYEEWAYTLAEHMEEKFEENETAILTELEQSGATHVVFDKENLFFGEDMQYPKVLGNAELHLSRMDETRHYVIYERAE